MNSDRSSIYYMLCCLVTMFIALYFTPVASAQGRLPEIDFYSNTPEDWDAFGHQVAQHNDRLLVSAPAFDSQAPAFVYLYDKNTNELVHVFHPEEDLQAPYWYAGNIAISDDCIVISAVRRFEPSQILIYDPVTFELVTSIELSPDMVRYQTGIRFALDGPDLLIGFPFSNTFGQSTGQALLYHAPSATLIAELVATEYESFHYFGSDVQINSKHIVISASGYTTNNHDFGAIYLFDRETGQQLNKLVNNQVTDDRTSFGFPIELYDNTLAVRRSSIMFSEINNTKASIQLFDLSNPVDQPPNYSVIDMPETVYNLQGFGNGLAMNENYISVNGTMEFSRSNFTNGVYIFDLQSHSLIEVVRANRVFQTEAYTSFALDSMDRLYFGHMLNGIEGPTGPGIVHQYQLTDCPQDLNHDGALDILDINEFVMARMDWNDTLTFNFFDVSAFIKDFLVGCP